MIISHSLIEKTIEKALSTGADFAEVFIEDSWSGSLSVLGSVLNQSSLGQNYGAGVRVHFGTEEVYVTTSDLTEKGLLNAAERAAQYRAGDAALRNENAKIQLKPFDFVSNELKNFLSLEEKNKKVDFLLKLDQELRKTNSLVTQTQPNISSRIQKVQIANSRGLHIVDERKYHRLATQVFVEDMGKKDSFFSTNQYSISDALFFNKINMGEYSKSLVDKALTVLKAELAPAGELPVIIANAFGGVIFHEACGHSLETTSVAPKMSVFSNSLNTQIASGVVDAHDDGTLEGTWGYLNYDDEGNRPQKTQLIKKGTLTSFMVDELGSKKTGHAVTGSGRRQNYKFSPTSRMRNTFIGKGTSSLDEMIKDVDFGIYAKTLGAGSVNPSTGEFNFNVSEGYIVERGEIKQAVKGASLIGRGQEILPRIKKVGTDLMLDPGTCGSASGHIPVTLGQPSILVEKILVGGGKV